MSAVGQFTNIVTVLYTWEKVHYMYIKFLQTTERLKFGVLRQYFFTVNTLF
jgi:hypothetical protein